MISEFRGAINNHVFFILTFTETPLHPLLLSSPIFPPAHMDTFLHFPTSNYNRFSPIPIVDELPALSSFCPGGWNSAHRFAACGLR